ncbi:MAG TPA: hypothetical protein VHC20_08315 [Candidatus Paceibacterota bacterium]|nr:hypothetical protein [Candidatus Paceibacterota bacterium]
MRPQLNSGTLGGRMNVGLLIALVLGIFLVSGLRLLRSKVATAPVTSAWRPCPFVVGKSYRCLKSFEGFRDVFSEGDLLTFVSTAHSRHDSMTGYFFSDAGGRIRSWDIHDNDDLGVHRDLFEEVLAP